MSLRADVTSIPPAPQNDSYDCERIAGIVLSSVLAVASVVAIAVGHIWPGAAVLTLLIGYHTFRWVVTSEVSPEENQNPSPIDPSASPLNAPAAVTTPSSAGAQEETGSSTQPSTPATATAVPTAARPSPSSSPLARSGSSDSLQVLPAAGTVIPPLRISQRQLIRPMTPEPSPAEVFRNARIALRRVNPPAPSQPAAQPVASNGRFQLSSHLMDKVRASVPEALLNRAATQSDGWIDPG